MMLLSWAPLVMTLLHAVTAPAATAAVESASSTPVAGFRHAASGRCVSYWVAGLQDPPSAAAAMARIEAAGGSAVASNFFLYCGDAVLVNGTFDAGTHADAGCDAFVAAARAKGMGVERVIGGPLDGLRQLFSSSATAAKAVESMAALVRAKNLTGLSWDVEPSGSSFHDALSFGSFNAQLRRALEPLSARVTVYSNAYSPIIADIADYAHGVDAVLTGETYNGDSYSAWLLNYNSVASCFTKSCATGDGGKTPTSVERVRARAAPLPVKMIPSMLASTERGEWNCEADGMQQRVARLLADNATELALFVLEPSVPPPPPPAGHQQRPGSSPPKPPSRNCIDAWFPYARAFLNGSV